MTVLYDERGRSISSSAKNRTLAQAAPELLEALKEVIENFGSDIDDAWVEKCRKSLANIRAAIAKAEQS